MNLTSQEINFLLNGKKYISYKLHLFDPSNQIYSGIYINKYQAEIYTNQIVNLVRVTDNLSMSSYNNSFRYDLYKIITGKNHLYVCLKKATQESIEFQEILQLNNDYPHSYCFYINTVQECDYIDLIAFLDIDVFMKHYKNTGSLSKNMFNIIQKYGLNQYKIYQLENCSNEPEYSQIDPNFKLSLFDYQKQTLNWMIRIENKDYKFLVPQSSFFKLGEKAYIELFNKHNNHFLSQYVFENDYQTNQMIKCRGGILADIMGNGKTVTTIALIYHNRPIRMPLLTSIVEREVYVSSRATLVVCPTNIAGQWESEIYKCLGPSADGLNIIKITTKAQMNKYKLSQLINADIIITTYTWLSHINHIGTGFIKKGKVNEFLTHQKSNKLKYSDNYHLYDNHTLLFIKYHRIIYDEFHEEIGTTNGQNAILYIIKNCLKAKNIWGISGTPLLDNDKIMHNIPELLQIYDTNNNLYSIDVISQHEVYNRFIRRNEKQYLSPINYHQIMIKQNVQEKQLYDSSLSQDIDTLMQLCCYHNINSMDIQNIDDVAQTLNNLRQLQRKELGGKIQDIIANSKQIEGILRVMNPTIKKVNELYYLIDSNHPQHTHKLVQQIQQTPTLQLQVDSLRQYRKYEKQLEDKKNELDKLDQCIKYYDQTIKNTLIDGTFICPITGENVGDNEIVITKDGHLFSKGAIEMLFEYGDGKHITCPVTNQILNRSDVTIVTNKRPNNIEEKLNSNEKLFGSKITKIIDKINLFEKNEKVIIFGKWDKLLHTIGYALSVNQIDHVYIKGSINIRDKAIHEFQQNPNIKAILLSSEFGASGVNLIEATNVFIVHPFYGDDGYQYEKQAIGRSRRTGQTKTVNVSFFITENTIEQDLWEKNRKQCYINIKK